MKRLSVVVLSVFMATATVALAGEGDWAYKGWTQWHPQQGSSSLAGVGTQCYFCTPDPIGDADKDGVLDDKDQCPDTPKGDKVDEKGCSLPKATRSAVVPEPEALKCPAATHGAKADAMGCLVLESVHFDTNKSVIKSAGKKILDQAALIMKDDPAIKLAVDGHTDSRGSVKLNNPLSERRAKAVRDYLAGKGVAVDRVIIASHGESQPLADNTSVSGQAQNRRADLRANY